MKSDEEPWELWARRQHEYHQWRENQPKCRYEKALAAALSVHKMTITPGDPNSLCECGAPAPCPTVQAIFDSFEASKDDCEHKEVHRMGY